MWPPASYFEGKKRSQLDKIRLARVDWAIGTHYIESIKFNLSNGDASPKFGKKGITDIC